MRRWSAGVVACALAVPLLLAGCSEKHPASQSLPTTSKTAAAATLPPLGPADFPVPAEARQANASGAENALRYYLKLLTHQAGVSGQPLRSLSTGCSLCDFLADRYDRDAESGYSYRGGDIRIESMGPPALQDGSAEFSFTASQDPVAVLDASGEPVPGRGEGRVTALNSAARLAWSDAKTAWIVQQLSFQTT